MSKVEYYKISSNYKTLVEINDSISKNLLELYNNNIWNIKSTFKDYKKYCDELGKTCINAWDNNIMLYDYIWNTIDISSVIINTISLNELESGKYNSLYTNDKINNIKTDAGYANRIKFFIKTFPLFAKFKDEEDLSWVAINNRELLYQVLKYHNDAKHSIATINKDLKTIVRVIKLLVGEDNELRYKISAIQVLFTDLENYRDDDNQIVTENEKKQFINYETLLEILNKLLKEYQNDIRKLPKSDRKNGFKHSDNIYAKHQIILALALNIWDFPSRHEKYVMDIVYNITDVKPEQNYILLKKLKSNKVSKIIYFIFNENVKKHTAIKYKLDSTLLKEYNKKLANLIKYSFDTYPRPYLFLGKNNWEKQNFNKASFNTICEFLRNISMHKNICIDGFRSAFISYYYPKINNKDKEIVKTRMRTSREIIERFYLKYETKSNKENDEVIVEEKPKMSDELDKVDKQEKAVVMSLAEQKRLNYRKWYEANKEKKLQYNHNRNIDPKTKQRNILNDLNTGKTTIDNYKKETIEKYKIYRDNEKYYGRDLNI